jgi:hypothetical protein
MASKDLPSPETLRQLLRYDPDTGKMFWLHRGLELFSSNKISAQSGSNRWNAAYAGREAGTYSNKGYKIIGVLRSHYSLHRVAWAMHYGAWPDGHLDHANGARDDNRIENLRQASRSQNNQNVRSQAASSSVFKGVTWDKSRKKWAAGIKKDFVRHNLGRFSCEVQAAKAHDEAAVRLYGAYAKLNFPKTTPSA